MKRKLFFFPPTILVLLSLLLANTPFLVKASADPGMPSGYFLYSGFESPTTVMSPWEYDDGETWSWQGDTSYMTMTSSYAQRGTRSLQWNGIGGLLSGQLNPSGLWNKELYQSYWVYLDSALSGYDSWSFWNLADVGSSNSHTVNVNIGGTSTSSAYWDFYQSQDWDASGWIKKAIIAYGYGGAGPADHGHIEHLARFDMSDCHITTLAKEQLPQVKAINPNITMLGYYDIIGVKSTHEEYATINANDWFIRDDNGNKLVHFKHGWYLKDIGDPDYQQHAADYCSSFLSEVYDGVFFDDAWSRLLSNRWTASPSVVPTDYWNQQIGDYTRWQTAMRECFSTIRLAVGNSTMIYNGSDEHYLDVSDGRMIEQFSLREGREIGHIDDLAYVSNLGKYCMASPFSSSLAGGDSHENFLFSFCCYLLGTNGSNAHFTWLDIWENSMGHYSEMDEAEHLGSPTGDYYSYQNVYARDFENGKVLANPSSNTYTVNLGESLYTREGETVSSVTMGAETGEILMNTKVGWSLGGKKSNWYYRIYDSYHETHFQQQGSTVQIGTHAVPFGRWFKFEIYIYRDQTDGIFKVWITDPDNPDPAEQDTELLFHIESCNTDEDDLVDLEDAAYFLRMDGEVGGFVRCDEVYFYNWNAHDARELPPQEPSLPNAGSPQTNTTIVGVVADISGTASSDQDYLPEIYLSTWRIEHNNTGTPTNQTGIFSGTSKIETWSFTLTLNDTSEQLVYFKALVNDSLGVWSEPTWLNITLTDPSSMPPDAREFNEAYGTSEGDPLYAPEADLDLDGYIGSADAAILNEYSPVRMSMLYSQKYRAH